MIKKHVYEGTEILENKRPDNETIQIDTNHNEIASSYEDNEIVENDGSREDHRQGSVIEKVRLPQQKLFD